jgi:REP element-mobilizing transposase RayT
MPWRPGFDPQNLYFITTKAVDYAHLFRRDVIKRILLDTLDCLRARCWLKLYSFVIMPNHIHCVAQFSAERALADFVRDYKHHTSDRIVRHLKAEANQQALEWLAEKAS